jgi:hypothetical protein
MSFPVLELARERHVRLSSFTIFNRFAIASGLISIFICFSNSAIDLAFDYLRQFTTYFMSQLPFL